MKEFKKLPQAESCRRIDFDSVEIRPGFVSGTNILIVTGTKPYKNMKVRLAPLVYIKRPEYWGIEVVGCLHGIGLPATTSYTASIQLKSITGTKGIEVIGATKRVKRIVPPK